MSIKRFFPDTRPTLDLNFAGTKRLDPRITFTRASAGTFIGADGLIQSAAINQARFDHSPTTGESLGLLVEEARTNLVAYSESLQGNWTELNLTISKETIAGPGGTIPYDKVTLGVFGPPVDSSDEGSTARARRGTGSVLASGAAWVASAYLKAGTCRYIYFAKSFLNSGTTGVYFDLQAGTVLSGGPLPSSQATISPVGNGWYRVSMYGTEAGPGMSDGINLVPMTTSTPLVSGSGTRLFTGNGETMYVYGVQYEAGAFPTSYIPTVASTVTRAADVATITGTNFTNWYNQEQGSFFLSTFGRGDVSSTAGFETVNSSSVGTPNGLGLVPRYPGSDSARIAIALNGDYAGREVGVILSSYPLTIKMAAAMRDNNTAMSANGIISLTITDKAIAKNVDYMRIGTTRTGASCVNSSISRITYWPVRLANSTLQALTAT
jgi:hypothetical protein